MKTIGGLAGIAAGMVLSLGGCSKASYETTPVTLSTTYGPVVCQLYTSDTVLWDEAISHPDTMQRAEADTLCRTEGQRQAKAG